MTTPSAPPTVSPEPDPHALIDGVVAHADACRCVGGTHVPPCQYPARRSALAVYIAALLDERERLKKERDAWQALAEHVSHCVECSQMSVENCDDGRALQNVARWLEWGGNARAEWLRHSLNVTVLRVEDGDATIVVDGYEASNTVALWELTIEPRPAALPSPSPKK